MDFRIDVFRNKRWGTGRLRGFTMVLMCCGLFASERAAAKAERDTLPDDWHLRDASGPCFGISLDKAYALLKGRKPVTVIAGVVDSGIDTLQEDLRSVLWLAPKKEKHYPGMHYGWSFLGSVKGNIGKENLELVRMIRDRKMRGDTLGDYPDLNRVYRQKLKEARDAVNGVAAYVVVLDALAAKLEPGQQNLAGFAGLQVTDGRESRVLQQLLGVLKEKDDFRGYRDGAAGYRDHMQEQLDYDLNPDFRPRAVVGDREADLRERFYGSPDVNAADPLHGTHVAGIIGAVRGNGLGMQGVADAVRILAVRVVPDGDERDKDVANGIRFAVDHGARVINMSFGKAYSPGKQVVDEAVAYAMRHDVLLVVAAGNEHLNLDSVAGFPSRKYITGGEAPAWLEVGASGPQKGVSLPAGFSNYGKTTVDLFAPGVDIYSTLPKGKYGRESGTSMACPVTCGIAALLRSYFPKLTAVQVKDILMRSVITDPGLADKCRTGGVVNAAKAVQMALELDAARAKRA